jgi:TolB-like protein
LKLKSIKITLLMAAIAFFTVGLTLSSAAQKVAVLPFEMNSTQDLTFLQKGLFLMLSSRLADPGKVELINRDTINRIMIDAQKSSLTSGTLNESKAKMIGANIGADYILYGSVTIFGESISLDVSMVDIAKQTQALTFSKQAKEPGAVITELNQIATEINYKVFDRTKEEIVPRLAVSQQSMPAPVNNFESPMMRYQTLLSTSGIINGIAVGNVDSDQGDEVVLIRDHNIEIFKPVSNGQLKSVKIIEDANYLNLISIDTLDMNKNGYDEIFISRIDNRGSKVSSIVYEYNGSDFVRIGKPLPWYLRVIRDPVGENILYGQTKGDKGPFSSRNVFKVDWRSGKYVMGEKLLVPRGFSVLSMAKGMVEKQGKVGFLFTDWRGKLIWFDSAGKIEWKGDEGFGGSKLYFKLAEKDPSYGEKVFFHPRSIVYDLNSDGSNEVTVIKNIEASNHLVAQLKNYRKGELEIFSWAEFGLLQKILPKKIPGQITDIAILKGNGDTPDRLLVAIVKKRNSFSKSKSKSIVVGYDIEKNH